MDRADSNSEWPREAIDADDGAVLPARFPLLPLADPAAWLRTLVEALPAAAYVTDDRGSLLFYNDAAASLWGERPPVGMPGWWRHWRLLARDGSPLPFVESLLAGPAAGGEIACLDGGGRRRCLLALRNPVPPMLGASGTLTMLADITERTDAEERLRAREEFYRYTIELSAQMPWSATAEGIPLDFDPRWLELTGIKGKEALIGGAATTFHPDDAAEASRRWMESVRTGAPFDCESRLRMADGRYRWFRARAHQRVAPDGTVIGWYGVTEDIHDKHVVEDEVRWTAEHDPLTELPNRRAFRQRLNDALVHAQQEGQRVGLLLLDIDRFKQVNDQLGHDAGDVLLQIFASRLRAALPDEERMARLGGDEFAVILPGEGDPDEVQRTAEALLASLRTPFPYRGQMYDCRASIGAAIYPQDGDNGTELLKSADIALYEAKTGGRGRVRTFRSGMRAELQRRASMISLARDALARGEVVPFYQPKVNLASGRITGFEALLRWRHERTGWQLPGMIAAAFDDVELASQLSDVILNHVIADLRSWAEQGIEPGRIAINGSAAELTKPDFAENILAKLDAAGLPGSVLELEVTEMVFLGRGADHVGRALELLSAAGVTIALDDFGTGFASLSHLKQYRVDVIKIDRSFISELNGERADLAILRALIGLGRNLGIQTVAEGIETRAQAARLRVEGCPTGQGFLFSPAVPREDVPALIGTWDRHRHRGRSC